MAASADEAPPTVSVSPLGQEEQAWEADADNGDGNLRAKPENWR